MSTWMINGPGQAMFLGNRAVSQFDPSSTVSPGQGYVPDEVAKMIVKEAGLRKSDTLPKRVIIGYLESMGLSAGLAPDVAMVLRDVYGVTPTFDESKDSGRVNLISELRGSLRESYPAPFLADQPEILNEVDELIAAEYAESSDEVYDVVLEHLAGLPTEDVLDIVEFYEWVGAAGFSYLADLVDSGPDGLAEEVLEGLVGSGDLSEHVMVHVRALEEAMPKPDPVKHKRTFELRTQLANVQKKRKEREGRAKEAEKVPSFRRQMKLHAKDIGGKADPLAAKVAAGGMTPERRAELKTRLADKQQANKLQKRADSRAAMKEKGKKALGIMKKVGGAVAGVGKKALGLGAKAAGAAVGGAVQGAAHLAGRAVGGLTKGLTKAGLETGKSSSSQQASSQAASGSEPQKKGILHRIAHGIGRFAGALKQGYKSATPGIQSQVSKDKDSEKKKEGPAKGATRSPQYGESLYRNGSLLQEMTGMLSGAVEAAYIPEPSDVLATIVADDVVSQAVIEAMKPLDWDEVSQLASIALLPIDESFALVSAYQDGSSGFFHEWRRVSSSVEIPSAMTRGTFGLLSQLSMDEGVVPKIVEMSIRALQAAGPDVASCVEEAYPDLGKTVYGPAGDPHHGPDLAKSFMSPHPAGMDAPRKGAELMTTRMFSDPEQREKERASKLADVVQVIHGMRQAAADSGVNPEGMFLNTYRDAHREKARYS